jgi:mono/diheme cytochrome c family protein
MRRLSAMLLCAAALLPPTAPTRAAESGRVEDGRRLAVIFCGACHAIGRTGASPHPAAPAFRPLDRRVDLDGVRERLRSGLFAGHADMPQFKLTRQEARAMHAYLQAIQSP